MMFVKTLSTTPLGILGNNATYHGLCKGVYVCPGDSDAKISIYYQNDSDASDKLYVIYDRKLKKEEETLDLTTIKLKEMAGYTLYAKSDNTAHLTCEIGYN